MPSPKMEARMIVVVLVSLAFRANVGAFSPVSSATRGYPLGKFLEKSNKGTNDIRYECNHQRTRHTVKYFCLQARSFYEENDDDDDDMDDDEIEEWYRKISRNNSYNDNDQNDNESQVELLQRRLKSGNYLDLLSLSVVIFFLATTWVSGGRLFSVESTYFNTYSINNSGKTRIYKYIDAEKLLQQEFEQESSTVRF